MNLLMETDRARNEEIDRSFLSLGVGRTQPPVTVDYTKAAASPDAKLMQKMIKTVFGFEPRFDSEAGHAMAMTSWVGDPLSDVAILKIRSAGQNPHQQIEHFLARGLEAIQDPSPELTALWNQVSTDPAWLDWDKLERGATIYRRFGVLGFQYQGISSLDSYRVENIGRTLMSTGQYSDETAFKRFLLTCNFWTEISEPGGMRLFGEGWKVALRVRLLHTLIRRAVFKNQRWDSERLGMPINQVGLLGAPLSSSLMLGKFTKILGFRTTTAEIEAMMHLWRYIAYLMGYCSPHFPTTVEEGLQAVFNAFNLSPLSEHKDGIRLGKSFLAAFKPAGMPPGPAKRRRWREYRANIAMTMFFVLPETRRLIEAPDPRFWAARYWLTHAPVHFWEDTIRHISPAYAKRLDQKISAQRKAWVARQLNEADLLYRAESKF